MGSFSLRISEILTVSKLQVRVKWTRLLSNHVILTFNSIGQTIFDCAKSHSWALRNIEHWNANNIFKLSLWTYQKQCQIFSFHNLKCICVSCIAFIKQKLTIYFFFEKRIKCICESFLLLNKRNRMVTSSDASFSSLSTKLIYSTPAKFRT